MAQEAIGAPGDRGVAGDGDDSHVPARPKCRDGPVPQPLREQGGAQRERAEDARPSPMEDEDLQGTRGQEGGVHRCHPREVGPSRLLATSGERALRVAGRERQLSDSLQSQEAEEREISVDGAHHSSSTSSVQKPGPMAMSSPRSPGRTSAEASVS